MYIDWAALGVVTVVSITIIGDLYDLAGSRHPPGLGRQDQVEPRRVGGHDRLARVCAARCRRIAGAVRYLLDRSAVPLVELRPQLVASASLDVDPACDRHFSAQSHAYGPEQPHQLSFAAVCGETPYGARRCTAPHSDSGRLVGMILSSTRAVAKDLGTYSSGLSCNTRVRSIPRPISQE